MSVRSTVRETTRALLAPKRLVPVLLVAIPLIIAQGRFSDDPLAVSLAIVDCLAFVLIAPLAWRVLVPDDGSPRRRILGLLAYAGLGTGVVVTLGVAVPQLLSMRLTFLTTAPSLFVSVALFLVGGWGLGRDIGLEASLSRERARAAALAREAESAQLLALRAHFDPHFLFNTLNAIAEWCRDDGETAERAILQLSSMLRTILQGVRSPTWPLSKELELMKALFSLHLIRDPAAFSLTWDVDEAAAETKVPPMVLLPLAENAVKHGPAAGHRGEIAVRVHLDAGAVLFSLENPGAYRGARPGSEGLPIVERRLAVAYGNTVKLDMASLGERTRAQLRLPTKGPDAGVLV
ncbi:histidine kinase [Pendulispora brunnea]|uniref:Histidine kinase n=1 Tax=Pendulispora brunnea TaxID=2905690 RepID=A0ABZ2KCD0_9BACT